MSNLTTRIYLWDGSSFSVSEPFDWFEEAFSYDTFMVNRLAPSGVSSYKKVRTLIRTEAVVRVE